MEAFCRNWWNLTTPEKSWNVSNHDFGNPHVSGTLLSTCFVFHGATFCGQLHFVQSITFAVYSCINSSDAWYDAWQFVLDNGPFFSRKQWKKCSNLGKKIADNNGPYPDLREDHKKKENKLSPLQANNPQKDLVKHYSELHYVFHTESQRSTRVQRGLNRVGLQHAGFHTNRGLLPIIV